MTGLKRRVTDQMKRHGRLIGPKYIRSVIQNKLRGNREKGCKIWRRKGTRLCSTNLTLISRLFELAGPGVRAACEVRQHSSA